MPTQNGPQGSKMPKPAILAATAALIVLMAVGCARPVLPGQPTPGADSWTTYTSPDSRVRFDHPSHMKVRVRPRGDASAPYLALSGSTPDDSIQVTFLLRLSDDPLPDYCTRMMAVLADAHTRPVTAREAISLGGGQGFRQEFREARGAPVEFIAVALEARPAYVHMTCGYPETSRAELRPVCERIVASLTINK
jgi:hypothetical protein